MEQLNHEIKRIVEVLNAHCDKNIEENPDFHVGEFVDLPNQCGCFKRNSQWYIFRNDERNFCTFTGPFGLNGIIYACAKLLYIEKSIPEYRFTGTELETYINNNFHSFNEIDNYNQ